MSAKLVIEHIVEQQGINLSTLMDSDFSQFGWLSSREPIINALGEKVSKSWYYQNKKEAIRIEYFKVFETFTYSGVEYPNTYVGVRKDKHWIDWAGEIGRTKSEAPIYFNLKPINVNDLSQGFTSLFMRKIAKEAANNLTI